MTENTPTPAELEPDRLLAELDRRAALPKDVPQRAFTVGIRSLLQQAAALIRARTAERDAEARARPDRETVERHVRAAVCGCGGGADAHPAWRGDQIVDPIVERVTDAVLALFGQEAP